jgi:hypothetical protein
MKKIFNSIHNFLCACAKAKYAADLARNGHTRRAQALYQD